MTAEQLFKRVKAGEIITVRAKNGHCFPMFTHRPGAYRCDVSKRSVSGAVVHALMKRRLIVPIKTGWYSEGKFKFNKNLRDGRGRFKTQSPSPRPNHPTPESK